MTAIKKRPSWLSNWTWVQYLALVEDGNIGVGPDVEDWPKWIAFFDKLVASAECEIVWKAIEARKANPAKEWIKRHPNEGAHWCPVDADRLIGNLLLNAYSFVSEGINEHDKISKSDRKRIGARIKKHANALLEDLREITSSTLGLPEHFGKPLEQLADDIYGGFFVGRGKSIFAAEESKGALLVGVQTGVESIESVLDALKAGAGEWARSAPLVSHLDSKTASRSYFIREMSFYFRANYGTPLRAQTAALARVIYGGDMDASAVAQLAPRT